MILTTPAATLRERAPLVGMQRTMALFGHRDAEGQLTQHPYGNIHELFRIRGPLAASDMFRTIDNVVRTIDAFCSRLTSSTEGDFFEWRPDLPYLTCEALPLPGGASNFRDSVARERMLTLVHTARDLRRESLTRVVLSEIGSDDHLLFIAQDHSITDGWTLCLLIRLIASVFAGRRSTDGTRQSRHAYLPWARQLVDDSDRGAAIGYWSRAMAAASDPAARYSFPGGNWLPAGQRAQRDRYVHRVSDPRRRILDALASSFGVRPADVLLAATQMAVMSLTGRFGAIGFVTNGRDSRAASRIMGLLCEIVITVRPEPVGESLADWFSSFFELNCPPFPTAGIALTELEPSLAREQLLILFNYIPSVRPVRLGPRTRLTNAGPNLFDQLEKPAASSRFAVRLDAWQYPGEDLCFCLNYDGSMLPEPDRLIRAMFRGLDVLAHSPDAQWTRAIERVHAAWSDKTGAN